MSIRIWRGFGTGFLAGLLEPCNVEERVPATCLEYESDSGAFQAQRTASLQAPWPASPAACAVTFLHKARLMAALALHILARQGYVRK